MNQKFFIFHFSFSIFVLLFLGAIFFAIPQISFALNATDILQEGGVNDTSAPLPKIESRSTADEKVNALLLTAIDSILGVAGFVAVVFVVMGGVRYTISGGDDDMKNGAKTMILHALAGLLVILFSYAALTNLIDFLETPE